MGNAIAVWWLLVLVVVLAAANIELAEAAKAKKPNNPRDLASRFSGGGIDDYDETTAGVTGILEENPDFVPLGEESSDEEHSDDDYSDSDDDARSDESDDDDDDVKARVSKKLKKTRIPRPGKVLKLLKKNRARVTIVLAVFAFRNEIFRALKHLSERHKSKNKVTDVLKLLLFVDFMRRMQTGGKESSNLMKFIGHASPLLGALLEKTMNYNPAYIPPIDQHFTFESLNEYYLKDGMALHKALHTRHDGLKWPSSSATPICPDFASSKGSAGRESKAENATVVENDDGRMVVVLDWTKLDTSITSLELLRQQVAFLLSEYRSLAMHREAAANATTRGSEDSKNALPSASTLEVLVLLESPGGSVSEYGLAGQHLLRLRNEPGITLTICVDKVAASGGYMLCCTASPGQLFAAPFALLGSIGVIGTQINVNKLLNDWGIEPLEFRGGKDKAPIGLLGPVSKDGKRTTQAMIDQTHRAFKQHVVDARPVLKDTIDEIGSGNVWLGVDAIDVNLVDAIKTSDEYIEEKIRSGSRVFKMVRVFRSGFLLGPRIGSLPTAQCKGAVANAEPSVASLEENIENWMRASRSWMTQVPLRRIKSVLSKTMHSFP
ncbi:unnamed protein product [Pseudo-nitzschia multistriata]|uniref:Peptidase S49 domain-containing protein n=1 Tax=Pseudo-nitzschia multistriata TaxID=183589 RepID=A0A448ZFG3_9STRA|nr:unnamed protein product [Pseudo-nitzschia multistriata]